MDPPEIINSNDQTSYTYIDTARHSITQLITKTNASILVANRVIFAGIPSLALLVSLQWGDARSFASLLLFYWVSLALTYLVLHAIAIHRPRWLSDSPCLFPVAISVLTLLQTRRLGQPREQHYQTLLQWALEHSETLGDAKPLRSATIADAMLQRHAQLLIEARGRNLYDVADFDC
jgi:hypothetical protein